MKGIGMGWLFRGGTEWTPAMLPAASLAGRVALVVVSAEEEENGDRPTSDTTSDCRSVPFVSSAVELGAVSSFASVGVVGVGGAAIVKQLAAKGARVFVVVDTRSSYSEYAIKTATGVNSLAADFDFHYERDAKVDKEDENNNRTENTGSVEILMWGDMRNLEKVAEASGIFIALNLPLHILVVALSSPNANPSTSLKSSSLKNFGGVVDIGNAAASKTSPIPVPLTLTTVTAPVAVSPAISMSRSGSTKQVTAPTSKKTIMSSLTPQNLDPRWVAIHFAPVLFTMLLLPAIKSSQTPTRVVLVAPAAPSASSIDYRNFDTPIIISSSNSASNLNRRANEAATATIQFIRSLQLFLDSDPKTASIFINYVYSDPSSDPSILVADTDCHRAAITPLYVAAAPEIESLNCKAKYFMANCNIVEPNSFVKDPEAALVTWQWSQYIFRHHYQLDFELNC
ncbi:hypothetical protein HK100_003094 [Physocladia obscura]|uniref:Uncharacterized protein n=1 Tax=Physocladia obscura TaxID=109957 RepID=A0AAD5XG19_9FUNG|nr:hypothetical protein HK100_003094 [Physocladia obscura]